MDFTSACAAIKRHQQSVADDSDPVPESTGCSPAVQLDSSAGNVTGTRTSTLRWPSLLRCWQAIFTGSGTGTPPTVHTATALTRRQSTWSSIVQHMSRPEGTSGREDSSTRTHDASGTSWNGLGRVTAVTRPPDRE